MTGYRAIVVASFVTITAVTIIVIIIIIITIININILMHARGVTLAHFAGRTTIFIITVLQFFRPAG